MQKTNYEKNTTRIVIGVGILVLLLLGTCGWAGFTAFRWVQRVGDDLSVDTTFSTIVAKPGDGSPEFLLLYGNSITGISTLTVLDMDDHKLWEISGQGMGKPATIVYGQLPPDPDKIWKQTFPENGEKPKDIRGLRVKVELSTRFVIAFGAGHQTVRAEYEFPKPAVK